MSNLLLQCHHMLLQFLQLLLQGALVVFKQEQALSCRRVTLAAKLGKEAHLRQGHARFPQVDEQADPIEILVSVAAMSACGDTTARESIMALPWAESSWSPVRP